jgi:hypothetical protein
MAVALHDVITRSRLRRWWKDGAPEALRGGASHLLPWCGLSDAMVAGVHVVSVLHVRLTWCHFWGAAGGRTARNATLAACLTGGASLERTVVGLHIVICARRRWWVRGPTAPNVGLSARWPAYMVWSV